MAQLNIDQLKQPKEQTVAVLDPNAASRSSTPKPVVEPDTGTEISEAALGLDAPERLDLQLRLRALGYELDTLDGTFGPMTRRAIADWQKDRGLPPSSFFTLKQHGQLIAETEALMEAVRARTAAEKAAADKAVSEKATSDRLAAEPRKPPEVQTRKSREMQAPKPREAVKSERKKSIRKSRPATPSLARREKPAKNQRFKICNTVRGAFQVPANEACSLGM
ncbi:MAG: peptidoglycan-binding domain-containing protein [Mesorhizobium sp.]